MEISLTLLKAGLKRLWRHYITQKVKDPGGNVVLIMIQTQMIVIICFAFIVIIY